MAQTSPASYGSLDTPTYLRYVTEPHRRHGFGLLKDEEGS
jgi:hypothetical protein